jgi:hypothetical protein
LFVDEIRIEGREVCLKGKYAAIESVEKPKMGPYYGLPSFGPVWLPAESNHGPDG